LALWIALGVLPTVAVALLLYLIRSISEPAPDGPEEFLGRPRTPGETLVACLGDSHTHGRVGADWVKKLRMRMGMEGWLFINAGHNGDVAWNVAQRLEPVIACDPDYAIVLVGSNDVMAACHPDDAAEYVKSGGLPQAPDIGWYEGQLREIVRRLKEGTHAEVILCTIPPLGEAKQGEVDGILAAHNAVVGMIGRTEKLDVLPVHRLLSSEIRDGGPVYVPGDRRGPMLRAIARRYLRGRTWDEAGAEGGYSLLTDGVHLGERAAGLLSAMFERHLRDRPAKKSAPPPPF